MYIKVHLTSHLVVVLQRSINFRVARPTKYWTASPVEQGSSFLIQHYSLTGTKCLRIQNSSSPIKTWNSYVDFILLQMIFSIPDMLFHTIRNGQYTFVCDIWWSSWRKPPRWLGQGPHWVPQPTAKLPPKQSTQRHSHNNIERAEYNNQAKKNSIKLMPNSNKTINVNRLSYVLLIPVMLYQSMVLQSPSCWFSTGPVSPGTVRTSALGW